MERKALETQLFNWKEWDEGAEVNDALFYNVQLNVAIGDFPVGTSFKSAYFSGSGSFLSLTDEQGNEHTFELKLSVGNQIAY